MEEGKQNLTKKYRLYAAYKSFFFKQLSNTRLYLLKICDTICLYIYVLRYLNTGYNILRKSLDDNKQLDDFMTESFKTIQEVAKTNPEKMPIFEDDKFRAVLFDYYKTKNRISVIIRTFIKEFAGYTTSTTLH